MDTLMLDRQELRSLEILLLNEKNIVQQELLELARIHDPALFDHFSEITEGIKICSQYKDVFENERKSAIIFIMQALCLTQVLRNIIDNIFSHRNTK